jgi:5-methylcytosine-specific restriction endonuclease McrA
MICTKCGENKPPELFKKAKSRSNNQYRSSWCKKCHSKDTSERTKKDRTKANINNKKYKKTTKGKLTITKYKHGESCKLARKRYNSTPNGRAAAIRWASNRRSRIRNIKNDLTHWEWQIILEKQDNKCNFCGITFDNSNILTRAERDHIIPLIMGGALTFDNIQALCKSCNASKSTKILNDAHFQRP